MTESEPYYSPRELDFDESCDLSQAEISSLLLEREELEDGVAEFRRKAALESDRLCYELKNTQKQLDASNEFIQFQTEELEKLGKINTTLQETLAHTRQSAACESRTLVDELSSLRRTLETIQQDTVDAREQSLAEINHLQHKLSLAREFESATHSDALKLLQEQLETARRHYETERQQVEEDHQRVLQQQTATNTALNEKVSVLLEEVATIQDEAATAAASHKKEINSLSEELDFLSKELSRERKCRQDIEAKYLKCETLTLSLQNQLKESHEEISNLYEDLHNAKDVSRSIQHDHSFEVLSSSNKDLSQFRMALREQQRVSDAFESTMTQTVKDLEQENSRLQAKLEASQKTCALLNRRVAVLESDLRESASAQAHLSCDHELLRDEVNITQDENICYREQISALQRENDSLRTQLAQYESDIDALNPSRFSQATPSSAVTDQRTNFPSPPSQSLNALSASSVQHTNFPSPPSQSLNVLSDSPVQRTNFPSPPSQSLNALSSSSVQRTNFPSHTSQPLNALSDSPVQHNSFPSPPSQSTCIPTSSPRFFESAVSGRCTGSESSPSAIRTTMP